MKRLERAGALLGLALGVVLSAGCAAPGPDRERPASERAPAKAAGAPIAPAGDEPTPPARVAPGVSPSAGPLTLERAIALALERNPDLRAAAARIAEAEARVTEATSAFLPQVQGRLSYARTDNPAQAFGMIVAQRRFSPTLDVNDPGATENFRPEIVGAISLFRGLSDWSFREAAKLGADARRLERQAAEDLIVNAVTQAFYGILAAKEQVEVARASIEAVTAERRLARERFEKGAALKSDVLSLEVRLAQAEEAALRARNGVEVGKAGLRPLLGLHRTAPLDLAPAPGGGDGAPPTATVADAIERALAARSEIKASERFVEVRSEELAAERGGHLPRVQAFASYGQDARDLELSRNVDNWAVGVEVEVDVFSGFRTSARVAAAEERLREAREGVRRVVLEVEQEVRTAFAALEEARERVRVTEAAKAQAEEALRLVREQYQAGTVPVTRYLEAEVGWADARSRSVAARYDQRRAAAALRKAMGGREP